MYKLQLFEGDDQRPRDARMLREGSLCFGRDPVADWSVTDPTRTLSRIHCSFDVGSSGEIGIVPQGTNGVFDDATAARLPDERRSVLDVPARIRLGNFAIVVTAAVDHVLPGGPERTVIASAGLPESFDVPVNWVDTDTTDASVTLVGTPGSLLEAFCAGAGLDASQLAREDPAEILRRVGTIYRQMILGIGDLMTDRDQARSRHMLARTTIGGANNNPFKWAPSHRLAIDLITGETRGFLSGSDALQHSFRDIKRHIAATAAGFRASLNAMISQVKPERLERDAKSRSLMQSRAAAALALLSERCVDLEAQASGERTGVLEEAFIHAYLDVDAQTAGPAR